MADGVPRVRRTPVPANALLVVRGDELDVSILTADAERFRRRFANWGRYGVSAFLAADDDEVDALCQSRLERFPTVVVFRRRDLESAGVEIVPTFRTPHLTLAHADLESLVQALLTCDHRNLENQHFAG